MGLKILSGLLSVVAVLMGFKQGTAMMKGSSQMLELFAKWGLDKNSVLIIGIITTLSAVMIIFPKTFFWGNWMMAATILLLICFHIVHGDWKGVLLELPFLALNLALIYLQHPLAKKISE